MKKFVSEKLIVASLAVALISGAATVTANAALDVTVSDAPVAAAPVESTAPVEVPASDFSAPSAVPSVVIIPNRVTAPEPGTMFAGFGLLTYVLFRTSRRSRA